MHGWEKHPRPDLSCWQLVRMANCKCCWSSTTLCVGLLSFPNECPSLSGLHACSFKACWAASCALSSPLHLHATWISAHLVPDLGRLEESTLALALSSQAPFPSCSFSPSSPDTTQQFPVAGLHYSICNSMDRNDANVIGYHFQQCCPTSIHLNDEAIVSCRYRLLLQILDSVPCFSSLGFWLQPVHYLASKVFS